MNSLRRVLETVGAPGRWLLVTAIRAYRVALSGWLGGQCRFYPSCSNYAEQAIRARGAAWGFGLALWRVARCNPFGNGGFDPPPEPRSYDGVIGRGVVR